LAEEPNYLAQAFKSQYNLIGLGTAIGFAVLSGSALPLLPAAGIQLAVLPLVAGSDRFQRLVKARRLEEERGSGRTSSTPRPRRCSARCPSPSGCATAAWRPWPRRSARTTRASTPPPRPSSTSSCRNSSFLQAF